MNEKVLKFLESKKNAERKKYEREKRNTLISLGLYDKVYSPDNKYSDEYPIMDWNGPNGETAYYKEVPVEVTDEEYQEIKKYAASNDATENNSVAVALTVIAWVVFAVGFVAGIIMGTMEAPQGSYYKNAVEGFSIMSAFVCWCVAFVSGMMFLGFAEIIKLLDIISKKKSA